MNHHIVTTYYAPTEAAKRHYNDILFEEDVHFVNAGSLRDSTDPWVKEHIEFETDTEIAKLNPHWCELTTLWHAWKNLSTKWKDDDTVQHSHYRKFLQVPDEDADAYVPRPYPMLFMQNKSIARCTIATGTMICHPLPSWKAMEMAICDTYQDTLLFREWADLKKMPAPINIWRTKVSIFKEYCEWMFPKAFWIEGQIPYGSEEYKTAYQRRALSFIGERMWSFWCWKMQRNGAKVIECPWKMLEDSKPITDAEERRIRI